MVISSNESLSHQLPPQVRGAQKICVQQEVPAFEGNLSLLWSNVSFVILRYVRFVIFPQDLWSSASSQSPRERCFSVSNTLFPASFQAQLFRHTQKKTITPNILHPPRPLTMFPFLLMWNSFDLAFVTDSYLFLH